METKPRFRSWGEIQILDTVKSIWGTTSKLVDLQPVLNYLGNMSNQGLEKCKKVSTHTTDFKPMQSKYS